MTPPHELTDRYAHNDGVAIHYMAAGSGPLVVFIHGFPDFWYTWRHQIEGLQATSSVAAIDTRGFNLSDAPKGVEHYSLDHLVDDVAAVIDNEGHRSATIVGHDWGGVTAWAFAAARPELTDRLVIVNVPHPAALAAELRRPDNEQGAALAYTDRFCQPGSEQALDAAALASFVARDPASRERYVEAFERSDFEAMMNYYRRNVPDLVHGDTSEPIGVPVLQFHGLDDLALLADSLNGTWHHLTQPWTLVTIPNAGHWPHHDQPELVTDTMRRWLAQPIPEPDGSTHSSEPGGRGAPTQRPDAAEGGCCAVSSDQGSAAAH